VLRTVFALNSLLHKLLATLPAFLVYYQFTVITVSHTRQTQRPTPGFARNKTVLCFHTLILGLHEAKDKINKSF